MNKSDTFYKSTAILVFATGILLSVPLVAMQFTNEVVWTLGDFVVAGILLFSTGLTYISVTTRRSNTNYRVAVGVALGTGLFLIWSNLAVGIIGSEDNPINLLYFGVIAVGLIGAFIARFQPDGMAKTMFAMALAQVLVAAIALTGGFYPSPPGTLTHLLGINGFFAALFAVSALLFLRAAQEQPPANLLSKS